MGKEQSLDKQGSGIRQAPQSPTQNSSSLPVPAAPVPATDLGDSFLRAGPFSELGVKCVTP